MSHTPTHSDVVGEVDPAWKAWVGENVLLGVPPREIVAGLQHPGGYSEATAQHEVMTALDHPYVYAARKLGVNDPRTASGGTSARADKYAWWMEVQRRTAKLSSTHGTIPRVKLPSRQAFLDEFYSPNLPCLIEGAMDDWAAVTKWQDPAYLKAKCGDQVVEVQGNRNAADANQFNVNQRMPFGQFVDIVESGDTNDWYMTANNDPGNSDALAALWDDVVMPDFLSQDKGPIGGAFVWYGPGGTLSRTHHDLTNNLMAQVVGRKRVKIVAPNESAHIYNDYGRDTQVSLEQPDLAAHPAMEGVTIMDVVIEPGDMLFLPVGWWHSVRALDVSFTFTFTNFVYDDNDFYSFYTSDKSLTSD